MHPRMSKHHTDDGTSIVQYRCKCASSSGTAVVRYNNAETGNPADCLVACSTGGNACCRLNKASSPAKCHGGSYVITGMDATMECTPVCPTTAPITATLSPTTSPIL
eukprot:gene4608-biopygen6551